MFIVSVSMTPRDNSIQASRNYHSLYYGDDLLSVINKAKNNDDPNGELTVTRNGNVIEFNGMSTKIEEGSERYLFRLSDALSDFITKAVAKDGRHCSYIVFDTENPQCSGAFVKRA